MQHHVPTCKLAWSVKVVSVQLILQLTVVDLSLPLLNLIVLYVSVAKQYLHMSRAFSDYGLSYGMPRAVPCPSTNDGSHIPVPGLMSLAAHSLASRLKFNRLYFIIYHCFLSISPSIHPALHHYLIYYVYLILCSHELCSQQRLFHHR